MLYKCTWSLLILYFLEGRKGFLLQVRGIFHLGIPVSDAVIVESYHFKSNELNLETTELSFV